MRKFLGLLLLVPLAAILVLSCDDHPTAPEEVQAATTVRESATPQATKAPPLPTPVVLSGAEVVLGPWVDTSILGSHLLSYAVCPDGKIPLTGGYSVSPNSATGDFLVFTNAATRSALSTGWTVNARLTAGTYFAMRAYAVCVDAVVILD